MQEHHFAERGIFYRMNEWSADRKTLVFVHGLSGSLSAWLPFEKVLGARYNILTFDLRGHGKSKRYATFEDYALKNFASDTYALLQELGVERCTLVTHSFGTLVALHLLHKHPKRVEKLILLSPNYHLHALLRIRLVRPLFAAMSALLRPFLITSVGGHTDYTRHTPAGDWSVRRLAADIGNTGLVTYLWCLRQAYNSKDDAWWESVLQPTLIIHGTKDSIVPLYNAELLSRAMPNAKMLPLAGANHILPLNNVSEVCEALTRFVE